MDFIYVVGMFCLDEAGNERHRTRANGSKYAVKSWTAGWFKTEETARKMVMSYAPWDHLYNYAVIEKVPWGFHCLNKIDGEMVGAEVIQWYKMTFIQQPEKDVPCRYDVAECPAPAYADGTVNFTMG